MAKKNKRKPAKPDDWQTTGAVEETTVHTEVTLRPVTITLQVPMLRLTGLGGGQCLPTRRLDIALKTSEAQAMRDLADGLRAAGLVRPNAGHKQTLSWLLSEICQKFDRVSEKPDSR